MEEHNDTELPAEARRELLSMYAERARLNPHGTSLVGLEHEIGELWVRRYTIAALSAEVIALRQEVDALAAQVDALKAAAS